MTQIKVKHLALIVGALIVILLAWGAIETHATKTVVEATVKRVEVKRNNNRDTYMVFTDKEVFENTDNWWVGKFNSSDFYGQLDVGRKYRFTVSGVRNRTFSLYRNILEAEPLD